MDTRVSPATVVVVLVLVFAILLGLYFLLMEQSNENGLDGVGAIPPQAPPGPLPAATPPTSSAAPKDIPAGKSPEAAPTS